MPSSDEQKGPTSIWKNKCVSQRNDNLYFEMIFVLSLKGYAIFRLHITTNRYIFLFEKGGPFCLWEIIYPLKTPNINITAYAFI